MTRRRASRLLLLVAAGLLATVGGCVQQSRPAATDTKLPPVKRGSESVTSLGLSSKGLPLTLHSFNAGARPVLILAAIHGDEATTAYCANQLIQLLRSDLSLIGDIPVAILPVANPDGLAAHTRVSAAGVDLNRNFPAANWTSTAPHTRNYNGPSPASEPETQILIRLVETLQPRRICSMHSIGQGRQQNNYDGPARDLAELMAQYNHYPASPTIGYPTPGSFGSWAGIDRRIPMITLELPARTPGPQAWIDNREALLAFIRGK